MILALKLQIFQHVAGFFLRLLGFSNLDLSWQDLKDFIRDNARVEPDFCDAHKVEDRLATGKTICHVL